jgi:pyruvate formate lyase activating enzyme
VWLEVTTLVIPGENDDPGELRELTAWLVSHLGAETPWHVSRFFPAFRMLDRSATPLATLRRAAEIGREAGLRHVYVGNAPALAMEDTHCAGCDAVLLTRRGYHITRHLADDGTCPACGQRLAGRALEVGAREVGAAEVGGAVPVPVPVPVPCG